MNIKREGKVNLQFTLYWKYISLVCNLHWWIEILLHIFTMNAMIFLTFINSVLKFYLKRSAINLIKVLIILIIHIKIKNSNENTKVLKENMLNLPPYSPKLAVTELPDSTLSSSPKMTVTLPNSEGTRQRWFLFIQIYI